MPLFDCLVSHMWKWKIGQQKHYFFCWKRRKLGYPERSSGGKFPSLQVEKRKKNYYFFSFFFRAFFNFLYWLAGMELTVQSSCGNRIKVMHTHNLTLVLLWYSQKWSRSKIDWKHHQTSPQIFIWKEQPSIISGCLG